MTSERSKLGANDAAGRVALSQWAIRKGLWEDALDLADQALSVVQRGRAETAVALPRSALRTDGEQDVVLVVRSGRVERRAVKVAAVEKSPRAPTPRMRAV